MAHQSPVPQSIASWTTVASVFKEERQLDETDLIRKLKREKNGKEEARKSN
jgi:hypothetical protein